MPGIHWGISLLSTPGKFNAFVLIHRVSAQLKSQRMKSGVDSDQEEPLLMLRPQYHITYSKYHIINHVKKALSHRVSVGSPYMLAMPHCLVGTAL